MPKAFIAKGVDDAVWTSPHLSKTGGPTKSFKSGVMVKEHPVSKMIGKASSVALACVLRAATKLGSNVRIGEEQGYADELTDGT